MRHLLTAQVRSLRFVIHSRDEWFVRRLMEPRYVESLNDRLEATEQLHRRF